MRLFLAANSINFSILRSDDGCVDDDDWEEMVEQHLLSESEVGALRACVAASFNALVTHS